ncbi:hypothetical protein ID866_8508 [Astraeus odoratus]|nr:hypothetical protein ID866_8508 [Astraeus odoratus]
MFLRGTKHLDLVIKEKRKRITEDLIGNGWYNTPNDYLQWVLDDRRDYDASHIIQRILSINFVINSTTASVFTQALYNLAANQEYIQPLREEVEAIVYQEGWSKDALTRMRKVDSFLKETMRLEGVSPTTIMRKAMKDFTLSDGTVIPTGTLLVVATERIHRDAAISDNYEGFEPFRFTGVQDASENIYAKQQMMAINRNWLGYGYGKHAWCEYSCKLKLESN